MDLGEILTFLIQENNEQASKKTGIGFTPNSKRILPF
jgi:hypothetical protein